MKKIIIKLKIFFLIALISGCAAIENKKPSALLRVAVIGNTMPESPFSGESEKLPEVISRINRENPILVIHTGNIVHGGLSWMGIKITDVERQYLQAKIDFSKLSSNLYTVLGEKDLYNDDHKLYTAHFGRRPNYGFNLPNLRFIVFNTVKCSSDSGKNIEWLEGELKSSGGYDPVIIITHTPVFSDISKKGDYADRTRFHDLIIKYPVRAVISGNGGDSRSFIIDSVKYIIAGCGGYSKGSMTWRSVHYYMIEISDDIISIAPVKPSK